MSSAETTAAHDLFWSPSFGLRFQRTGTDVQLAGDFVVAKQRRDELLELNPNMVLLLQIDMRGTDPNSWHLKELYDGDDFPFIVENGELVFGTPPERYTDILIDFTHPLAQEIIVNQVIAVAVKVDCGTESSSISGMRKGLFLVGIARMKLNNTRV